MNLSREDILILADSVKTSVCSRWGEIQVAFLRHRGTGIDFKQIELDEKDSLAKTQALFLRAFSTGSFDVLSDALLQVIGLTWTNALSNLKVSATPKVSKKDAFFKVRSEIQKFLTDEMKQTLMMRAGYDPGPASCVRGVVEFWAKMEVSGKFSQDQIDLSVWIIYPAAYNLLKKYVESYCSQDSSFTKSITVSNDNNLSIAATKGRKYEEMTLGWFCLSDDEEICERFKFFCLEAENVDLHVDIFCHRSLQTRVGCARYNTIMDLWNEHRGLSVQQALKEAISHETFPSSMHLNDFMLWIRENTKSNCYFQIEFLLRRQASSEVEMEKKQKVQFERDQELLKWFQEIRSKEAINCVETLKRNNVLSLHDFKRLAADYQKKLLGEIYPGNPVLQNDALEKLEEEKKK